MKKGAAVQRKVRLYFMVLFSVIAVCWAIPSQGRAYVMPAEQLVALMAANFAEFRTLIITQSTYLANPEDPAEETVFDEKIWLQSPGFYRSELLGKPEAQPTFADGHVAYRRLLMANYGDSLLALLSDMGVRLDAVELTRFEGIIAYRLGEKGAESPKLFIEKQRFLPLVLSYRPPGDSSWQMVTVRFEDYRKLAGGWYPYKIVYLLGTEGVEQYFVRDVQVNAPLEASLFKRPAEAASSPENPEDRRATPKKEGLREMIQLLKEKYR